MDVQSPAFDVPDSGFEFMDFLGVLGVLAVELPLECYIFASNPLFFGLGLRSGGCGLNKTLVILGIPGVLVVNLQGFIGFWKVPLFVIFSPVQ